MMKGYNTIPEQQLIEDYLSFEQPELEEIIAQADCSAIIAVEYKLGMLAAMVCDKLGLERKICVFDDLHKIHHKGKFFMHVKQDEYRMGIEAVKLMKQILEGKNTETTVYVPYRIVE